MKHRKHLFSAWSWAPGLAVLTAVLLAMPARAQTTISADAGLGQYYKSQHWVPVPITLTNQGAPARVEVRARFSQGAEGVQEYRIPERVLQNNANERHVLYMKGPRSYAAQTLVVELYRDGRLLNVVRPRLALVNQPEWLVYGVGPPEFTAALNLMSTVTQTRPPGSLGMMGNGMMGGMPGVATGVPQPARINVGLVEPAAMPDRWHGFDAADMVVLGPASERDFTPDQLAALRDYVSGGGTLVITGGVNWNRLSAPFFADLLPVRVTGAGTLSSATGLRKLGAAGNRPASLPAGAFAVSVGAPKAGATVEASEGGTPLVVSGRKGSGRVLFLAFDPAQPPFREWAGTRDLWKNLLTGEEGAAILPAIAASEEVDPNWYSGGMSPRGQTRLADAPYSIPQLDIPAFYIVALFLLAYIIVLVPVNYFVLKARDKKEYAWLTTPAIVAVFSLGAYMIGYGFKGGRTLVVKVGVIEARAGHDAAPNLFYAGLFSPRKTGYGIQLATQNQLAQADAASTLFSQPEATRQAVGMRFVQDNVQKVEDFAVDMWAMRVLKAEGITHLGNGFTARLQPRPQGLTGEVTNNSPYSLDDCTVVVGDQLFPVASLSPGQRATFTAAARFSTGGMLLPPTLLNDLQGNRPEDRMKRAVLQPLCTTNVGGPRGSGPMLVGWVREPVSGIQVDGRDPRELSATLMVVHLGQAVK